METKLKTRFSLIIVCASFLVLAVSCKKKEGDNPETVTDIDGNVYNTVTIVTQVWFKENLKTTKYSNGDIIGTTNPASLDISGENEPKYQWAYEGNESNVATYGRLYTWYVASDSRNICPAGWHVPNSTEVTDLINNNGGEDIAGGKLKEEGIVHWDDPNTDATNSTGFTALPGGNRVYDGRWWGLGSSGNWWSTSIGYNATGFSLHMSSGSGKAVWSKDIQRTRGLSIRCIKD